MSIATLAIPFRPSARYEGVRPFNIWLLRLVYFLGAAFVGTWAWGALLTHEGPWDQYRSVSIAVWAAYPTLMAIGLIHPLRMLPIVFFSMLYKGLWLGFVAYPMWQAGTLTPSAIAMAKDFLWLPLGLIAIPWGYSFRTFVSPKRHPGNEGTT